MIDKKGTNRYRIRDSRVATAFGKGRGGGQERLGQRVHLSRYVQEDSSAYAGIDYTAGGGFYAGTWLADGGFGEPQDYTFTARTVIPYAGFHLKLGHFSRDFDGDYFESGYTWTLEEHDIDLSSALTASDDLNVSNGDNGEAGNFALAFGIKKSLGLTR